ncbi:TlpA disulfide reductase family protein [Peptostreptococcaceae bacterium AGR-M142]
MKKFISLCLGLMLSVSLVACNNSNEQADKKEEVNVDVDSKEVAKGEVDNTYMKFDDLGVKFKPIESWSNKENFGPSVLGASKEQVLYGAIEFSYFPKEDYNKFLQESRALEVKVEKESSVNGGISDELNNEITEFYKRAFEEMKKVVSINIINDDLLEEGTKIEDITNTKKNKLVKEMDNLSYYLSTYDLETQLSEESKAEYDEIIAKLGEFEDTLEFYKPITQEDKINEISNNAISFDTIDLNSNKVTQDIFKDKKLTMINIWGTFCGPCINEMPDLQELYIDIKDEEMNLIGIVSDIKSKDDSENIELAKKILDQKKAKFMSIIPDENLKNNLLSSVSGVPTTIFVDSKGNIVGEAIVGSRSKDEYRKEIDKVLSEMNK